MLIAITRDVSPALERCELTHLQRTPIDVERARTQHEEYETLLKQLGCTVIRAEAAPELPDSVFVEDAAVVVDELAVVTRPGATSRRGELPAIERALAPYRELLRIQAPGTLDGGDVLRVGRRLFAGRTARSNDAGIDQLRGFVTAFGYTVEGVAVHGCLHLKTAVTALRDDLLLINRQWVDTDPFRDLKLADVDPTEPSAANVLCIGERVVVPAAFTRTRERLERLGLETHPVPADELAKAEGGVTCCSLVFSA